MARPPPPRVHCVATASRLRLSYVPLCVDEFDDALQELDVLDVVGEALVTSFGRGALCGVHGADVTARAAAAADS